MPTGTGPHRRPTTGPTPQPGRATPPYGYPQVGGYPEPAGYSEPAGYPDPGAGWQDRQWPDDGYDGNWYPEEPQWDGGFPETDPNLKYREPGPGMPGYRGSREHRYGGDRY